MKKIDDIGILLAKYQASLFELTTTYLDCSSSYFYKKYMNSELSKRINSRYFIFESMDPRMALDELKKEKDLTAGYKKYPSFVMRWIGYLISYWCQVYEVDTSFIYKKIKLDELVGLYEAYHSLDVEEAIKRINEAKEIKYSYSLEDQIRIIREKNYN